MARSVIGEADEERIAGAGRSAAVSVGEPPDPEALVRTCLNCGATMSERACKLVCACGYFASCSDHY